MIVENLMQQTVQLGYDFTHFFRTPFLYRCIHKTLNNAQRTVLGSTTGIKDFLRDVAGDIRIAGLEILYMTLIALGEIITN